MPNVLGIDVDAALLARWREWYAPARRPLRTDGLDPQVAARIPKRRQPASAEHRDTFFLYGGRWTWLEEGEFLSLPGRTQRALRAAQRRRMHPKPLPVWPSALEEGGDDPLVDWVEAGVRTSDHEQVSEEAWHRARIVLPGAQNLAGKFPSAGSGPNCFATVVAAADEPEQRDEWMQLTDFSAWLERRASPLTGTSHDDEPGTVLVWTEHGALAHAAITLGDGWVLNKPSQSWSSPWLVWPVRHLVHSWRLSGTRLSRYTLR